MGLQEEIEDSRKTIRTDEYNMSIGEWISLYKEEEVNIQPEFQRFFRWSRTQKTRLIESILLGIPIPPIFVSQQSNGKWDVIDGLQRLSTILEFVGFLQEDGLVRPPLILDDAKYLPSLKNKVWDEKCLDIVNKKQKLPKDTSILPLTSEQRLFIRRAKLGVSILLRESDDLSKYEVFQRLNTGGSHLTYQEIRNCLLVMTNMRMLEWMHNLAKDENFRICVPITERALSERYDLELILRFLVLHRLAQTDLKTINEDMNEFLTTEMLAMAESETFDFEKNEEVFRYTFKVLAEATGENSFKKYDITKNKFTGALIIPAFEIITPGIASSYPHHVADIEQTIKNIWQDEIFLKYSRPGQSASLRIPKLVPLGRQKFSA